MVKRERRFGHVLLCSVDKDEKLLSVEKFANI